MTASVNKTPAANDGGKLRVAIAGATGVVGSELLNILTEKERAFPYTSLHLLASEESVGKRISAGDENLKVQALDGFDFSTVDLVFMCVGSELASRYAVIAIDKGCWVIDQSSLFRYQEHIPLIIPEINGEILKSAQYKNARLISNPNCSTIQLLMALYPIAKQVPITRLDVATYQSVSGAGKSGQEELASQTASLLNMQEVKAEAFPKQIAFNVLPQIDAMQDNGFTKEEMKVVWETEKILGAVVDISELEINVTAVRVPVFVGHAEAVHLQTAQAVSVADASGWFKEMPGVELIDDPDFPTPVTDAAGSDEVFVGRLRERLGFTPGLNFWVAADNLRRGGSLNAVRIAELLVKFGRFDI